MKKYIVILLLLVGSKLLAQDKQVTLKDLATPTSPAFIITDVAPTLVQAPGTPKAFILGVAQSYQQSGAGFPNNYAAEFTPYWWLKPGQMSVFDVQGIKTIKDAAGVITSFGNENYFSGLRFTSVSIAFISKDLIPDTSSANQKIFSIGIRTTLIKIHRPGYIDDLKKALAQWHIAAIKEMRNNPLYQAALARCNSKAEQDSVAKKYKPIDVAAELSTINGLLAQKPMFSWDIAAAYALYGINDAMWKSGRTGLWTTLSFNQPLPSGGKSNEAKNYFTLSGLARYQEDNFYKNVNGAIGPNKALDVGGQAALTFDQFSVAVEALYRYNNGNANNQNRTIGVINYKIADNIFLTGSFGKNFAEPDKLISALGISWGIGKETASLPDAK